MSRLNPPGGVGETILNMATVGTLSSSEEAQLTQTIEMFEVITQSQPQDYQSLEILKEAYLKLGRQKDVVNTSKRIAQAYVEQLNKAKVFPRTIVTQVVALRAFYAAEAYHQDYAMNHPDEPYIAINDLPKVENLRKQLSDLYVSNPARR